MWFACCCHKTDDATPLGGIHKVWFAIRFPTSSLLLLLCPGLMFLSSGQQRFRTLLRKIHQRDKMLGWWCWWDKMFAIKIDYGDLGVRNDPGEVLFLGLGMLESDSFEIILVSFSVKFLSQFIKDFCHIYCSILFPVKSSKSSIFNQNFSINFSNVKPDFSGELLFFLSDNFSHNFSSDFSLNVSDNFSHYFICNFIHFWHHF